MRFTRDVDQAEALEALPPSYAIALRLADEGADTAAIAQAAGVAADAVEALLEIGRGKLAALEASELPAGLASELGV